jgi:hypothetical protein
MSKEVEKYLKKLSSPQKELSERLRFIIKSEFPEIEEKMKYGVPYYDNLFYIVGLKTSVNLGFSIKDLTPDEIALFQGTGKTTRHLKYEKVEDINEEKVRSLLHLVYNKSRLPKSD